MPTATADDGASIAYATTGTGPALVLVHGITESHHTWAPLVAELALDFRVIALDLRGHGESDRRAPFDALTMATDVHTVVSAAGAPTPLVVGHSLGGAVVSLYAGMFPVLGTVAIDQPLDTRGFKQVLTEIEPALRGDDAVFRATVARIFDGLWGRLPDDERDRLLRHAHPEQDVVLGVWDTLLTNDAATLEDLMSSAARAITAPYLAIHGSDPGVAYREWLASRIPTSTIEIWDDDGHFPHLVERERFLDRVHDFALECERS